MKSAFAALAFAGAFGLWALPVAADSTSTTVFQHKHWQVEYVQWDDGTAACLGEVSAINESFSIWVYPDASVRIQFYSKAWEFGDASDTANLEVQIDRRRKWTLTDAELYKNSVLFNLPDSDEGVKFLVEIAAGTRLYLRSEDGSPVQDYSLAGSRASMSALIECGDALKTPGNPFK